MRWARVASRRSRPDVQGLGVTIQHDRQDPGLARDAADGLDRQRPAALGLGDQRLPFGGGPHASDERVVVDQDHQARPGTGLGPAVPGEQPVQGVGGQLVALAGGRHLGPGRLPGRDLGLQRVADRFAPDRIPPPEQHGHPGVVVDPGRRLGRPLLLLELTDPVVILQPVDFLAAALLERRYRPVSRHGFVHQLGGLLLESASLGSVQPVGLTGQDVGVAHPDPAGLQRLHRRWHLGEGRPPLRGAGRVPRAHARPRRRALGVGVPALHLQTCGSGGEFGQVGRHPGLHRTHLGPCGVDLDGRHGRDAALDLPEPGHDRDRVVVLDRRPVVHGNRHRASPSPTSPPCEGPAGGRAVPLLGPRESHDSEGYRCSMVAEQAVQRNPSEREIREPMADRELRQAADGVVEPEAAGGRHGRTNGWTGGSASAETRTTSPTTRGRT